MYIKDAVLLQPHPTCLRVRETEERTNRTSRMDWEHRRFPRKPVNGMVGDPAWGRWRVQNQLVFGQEGKTSRKDSGILRLVEGDLLYLPVWTKWVLYKEISNRIIVISIFLLMWVAFRREWWVSIVWSTPPPLPLSVKFWRWRHLRTHRETPFCHFTEISEPRRKWDDTVGTLELRL